VSTSAVGDFRLPKNPVERNFSQRASAVRLALESGATKNTSLQERIRSTLALSMVPAAVGI
jgi:hypothetical protein